MRKLLNILLEGIDLPIEIGDTVKMGKFKNKKVVIKKIEWNEKGDLLINGRPALKFRLMPKTNVFDKKEVEEEFGAPAGILPGPSRKAVKKNKTDKKSGYKDIKEFINKPKMKKALQKLVDKNLIPKNYAKNMSKLQSFLTQNPIVMTQLLRLLGENINENDKAQLMKLYTKAMKMMPHSPAQKKVRKAIDVLRKKLKMNEGTSKIKKVSGTLPTKITDKYKKLKDIPDGDVGKDFSQHHKYSQTAPMGNMAEPDTYDWDDDDKEQGGYQKEKDKKKKGYEPVTEASKKIKKVIAIYPGRFQPFGPHHKKVYLALKKKFGDVYIVTSNIKKPPKHPMNFKEKAQHITKMGIPVNKIVMDNPYKPVNLLKKFESEETAAVFAVGEKDKGRLSSGYYFDDYNKNKDNLKGYKEHGYVISAPHISVNVAGKEVSGTSMRQILGSSKIKPKQRKKLFKQLFGYFNDSVYKMMIGNFKNV